MIKDFNYIYASFFQVYKINLFKDKLTFKEFNWLFKNLPEDCAICKVIKIRGMDPNQIKDVELKKYRESILLNNDTSDALIAFAENIK